MTNHQEIIVPTIQLPHALSLALPDYQSIGAAGMDLAAAIEQDAPVVLKPGHWDAIPTGLVIALPQGFEAQIRPRSGLAYKFGIGILNAPGTIDSDYRGEVKVLLINYSQKDFIINHGDRIAQMVFASVLRAELQQVKIVDDTERGDGGFGSTGFS